MDGTEILPVVQIADELEGGDDGKLGVLHRVGEDTEVIETDIRAHASANSLVRFAAAYDARHMRAMSAGRDIVLIKTDELLHQLQLIGRSLSASWARSLRISPISSDFRPGLFSGIKLSAVSPGLCP